jgi:hypothetical protein
LDAVIDRYLELTADPGFQREDGGVQAGIMSLTAMLIAMRADEVGHAADLQVAASLGDRAARLADSSSPAFPFVTRSWAGAMAELARRTHHLADAEAAVDLFTRWGSAPTVTAPPDTIPFTTAFRG